MAQRRGRTQPCDSAQARRRLGHAVSFLEVAELAADVNDLSLEYASVAASIAILAGIAAADAACCHELGRRSRSDDHHDAESLLEQIAPGGKRAASHLRQLIEVKDTARTTGSSASAPRSSSGRSARRGTLSSSPRRCCGARHRVELEGVKPQRQQQPLRQRVTEPGTRANTSSSGMLDRPWSGCSQSLPAGTLVADCYGRRDWFLRRLLAVSDARASCSVGSYAALAITRAGGAGESARLADHRARTHRLRLRGPGWGRSWRGRSVSHKYQSTLEPPGRGPMPAPPLPTAAPPDEKPSSVSAAADG
jgi:hypothetical protein